MANLKQTRKRIQSVKSTQQITRVMEMVSASKLARTQRLLEDSRPYAQAMDGLLGRIAASVASGSPADAPLHPYLSGRPAVRRRCLAVLASDRGLCGAYNNNILSLAEKTIQGNPEEWTLACVGKKSVVYFTKRHGSIGYRLVQVQGKFEMENVRKLGAYLASGFESGAFDEVHLAYTAFRSAGKYQPVVTRYLPVEVPPSAESRVEYLFEPTPGRVLERLIPESLLAKLKVVCLEALASEHSARMAAMRNATENAEEMVVSLTLQMNKARQASITSEISEIVRGAEAIRG